MFENLGRKRRGKEEKENILLGGKCGSQIKTKILKEDWGQSAQFVWIKGLPFNCSAAISSTESVLFYGWKESDSVEFADQRK